MKGTRILVTSKPKGVYEDIYVTGTPKPGTLMEVTPSTEPVGNLFNYSVYGTAAHSSGQYIENDGDRKVIAILVERDQDGSIYSAAYVSGDLGRVYFPLPGEQFNMILENQGGTGDSFIIGQELMADDGTGKLLNADSNAQAHPFTCLETLAALTTDAWAWVRFNGEGGA